MDETSLKEAYGGNICLMPISKEYELIFIHVPRCAGTSVIEALDMKDRRHYKWNYHYRKHHSLWNKYTNFTIVRNPYSRAVSTYNYIRMKESYWHSSKNPNQAIDGKHVDYDVVRQLSFNETIKLLHNGELQGHEWQSQHPFIYDDGELMVDKILRFENLPDCFNELMSSKEIEVELPRLNSSNTKADYHKLYDKKTKERIEDIYQKDLELLNYGY